MACWQSLVLGQLDDWGIGDEGGSRLLALILWPLSLFGTDFIVSLHGVTCIFPFFVWPAFRSEGAKM
jgi:hypothetical protein